MKLEANASLPRIGLVGICTAAAIVEVIPLLICGFRREPKKTTQAVPQQNLCRLTSQRWEMGEDQVTTSPIAEAYASKGCERAMQLGNRGPVRLDKHGRLAKQILAAYHQSGFYVFTGVLSATEVGELAGEFDQLLDNAPTGTGTDVDQHGRPSRFAGYYRFVEGEAGADAPAKVTRLSHPLMLMDSALRVYGHRKILKVAEGVHGEDFVPFHETIFHKPANDGPPTSWHQDGRTHWGSEGESLEGPDGSGPSHGFNLAVAWSNCIAENCLWVVPGSHRQWRLAGGGQFPPITERIIDAVPMLAPGDCGMVNRSALHGAYPNRSAVARTNMVMGFHKRSSVIGAEVINVHAFKVAGMQSKTIKYDEEYVLRRARMIPLAIDARRQYYPDEVQYEYKGSYTGSGVWDEQARAEISQEGDEYWQRDITL